MSLMVSAAARYLRLWPAFFALVVITSPLLAQPTVYEHEPNDTPAQATKVSGAVVLAGAMGQGDQDGYMWTVSDVDAQKRWTFELQGIPGQLTVVDVVRLQYADNGVDVTGTTKLFTIGSRDGAKPSVVEDLIFEPGEYLLGVAHAGGGGAPFRPPVDSAAFGGSGDGSGGGGEGHSPAGAYRLAIHEGSKLWLDSHPKPHGDQKSAQDLRPDSEYAAFTETPEAWYRLNLDEKRAARRWKIVGQVPVGRKARAILRDATGRELTRAETDREGKFAFEDLGLSAGNYSVEVQTSDGGIVESLAARSTGQRVAGEEAEPNDRWADANRVDLTQPVTGRMSKSGDHDDFAFSLEESVEDQVLSLNLETPPDASFDLCLLDGEGHDLQCRHQKGGIELSDLRLQPGEYGLDILGRKPQGAEYTVRLLETGAPQPGHEAEPNDSFELANAVPANDRIKGRFNGDDTDFYRLLVTGKPQLWRFQVIGEGIHEVAYLDSSGSQSERARAEHGQRRVRLDNVFLLPGVHTLSVKGSGDGGEYTLLARPLGAPDPNAEREPNDDDTQSEAIHFGQRRTGSLSSKSDRDQYHFVLSNWDRIRLTIEPAADGRLGAQLHWGGSPFREWNTNEKTARITLEGLFPPGQYGLELEAVKPSDGDYSVHLERLDRFGCPVDCEPNDNAALASDLPPDLIVEGRVGEWRDDDWYALPRVARETHLRVAGVQGNVHARLGRWGYSHRFTSLSREAEGILGVDVPTGEQTFLVVSGDGSYDLQLQFDPGPKAGARPVASPVELSLKATTQAAAYSPLGQRLHGDLQLTNKGPSPVSLELTTAASQPGWRIVPKTRQLELAANQQTRIPVAIEVPADAWADRPVRLSVRARFKDGGQVETSIEVTPRSDQAPVGSHRSWAVPDALLGGFDVAWTALGGRRVPDPSEKNAGDIPGVGRGFDELFDGLALVDAGLTLRGGHPTPVSVDVELSGGPVEVVGVVLNPLSGHRPEHAPRDFEVQLSADGKDFTTALRGVLIPNRREQSFLLDEPVEARYARLLLSTTYEGRDEGILSLGEWKVIASPGTDISNGKGFNLTEPALGGHVVWSRPAISGHWDDAILPGNDEDRRVRVGAGRTLEWVVGFHDDRDAQITRLEWVDSPNVEPSQRIGSVAVAVSEDSPVGPWRSLGIWKLTGSGKTQVFRLDEPVWARFVKFSVPAAEKRQPFDAPREVRIWERPVDSTYRSILGEWGESSSAAIREALRTAEAQPSPASADNTSRERAASLAFGRFVQGSVALGRRVNWYRLATPAGDNTVVLELRGDPTVRVVPMLQDATGHEVLLRRARAESQRHVYEATVKPGDRYFLEVHEPPRNVMFVWDTSGSVNAYLPLIYQSLATYVEGVVPNRDTVNLLPFGTTPLLRDWVGEPYILQTVLNDYPRRESSSDAEKTLAKAADALADRAGTKAVVLITDAATPRYAEVWDALREVKPRVFALHLDAAGVVPGNRAMEADRMQDWSQVNGGHYTRLSTGGEMEVAFDRASALLRGPAFYGLTVTSEHREAPGPGSLTVVPGARGAASGGGGAVELILDASGSMLQHIGGKRRIEIAREVLTEAVTNWIPTGTPLALRVFGNKEANSCRTDLEIPLKPLDPSAVAKTIHGVNAMNLAKTPIADSLAAVASDLGKAKGPKIIVLVTDGEETCDGDPEKVLQELRDRGFDVTLNIVGFAIGDEDLQATFKSWAEMGGGHFFAASDQEGLSGAVANALRTSYSVYDDGGTQVGEGWVGGEPLELDAGVYRVVVQSEPAKTFDHVEVTGGSHVKLELKH